MFRDVGPIPNLLVPALFVVFGLIAVGWIQKQIQRRRLKKRQQFFTRVGESVLAKIPQRISFKQTATYSWSNPPKYDESKAALESLGFHRSNLFVASPQDWVVEFWLSDQPRLFAKIIDSRDRGVYTEVTVTGVDGDLTSFENTEDCGFRHPERDQWVHCGRVTPAELVEKALRERQSNDSKQINLNDCVSIYERSVNEHLAWRRSVGISADEVKHVFERMRKRSSMEA